MFVCVYVFSCTEVLVDVYSVLFCSCTGTQEMPALMEAEAVVAVLLRPADYCSEEWPTTTRWGKNFSNQQESGCSTLRSNMFNCLWCSPAPTAQGPEGGRQVQGLTFPFHSQPHSHIDWEMYQCSSLQHCSNYQTQTKLEPLSTGIGTLNPLENMRQLMHWFPQKSVKYITKQFKNKRKTDLFLIISCHLSELQCTAQEWYDNCINFYFPQGCHELTGGKKSYYVTDIFLNTYTECRTNAMSEKAGPCWQLSRLHQHSAQ